MNEKEILLRINDMAINAKKACESNADRLIGNVGPIMRELGKASAYGEVSVWTSKMYNDLEEISIDELKPLGGY